MKTYIHYFCGGILCFLCTFWTALLSFGECIWMETVAISLLTFYITYSSKGKLPLYAITLSILAGRLFLEIPVRICDFSSSVISLPITTANILIVIVCAILSQIHSLKVRFLFFVITLYVINIICIHFLPSMISTLEMIK